MMKADFHVMLGSGKTSIIPSKVRETDNAGRCEARGRVVGHLYIPGTSLFESHEDETPVEVRSAMEMGGA